VGKIMDTVWLTIVVAGLFEPLWVICMEKSEHFHNIKWTAAFGISLFMSLFLLSLAMPVLGAGIAYAIWTGIGAVCTLIIGATIYKEPVTALRIFFIAMIIAGIIGINLTSGGA
jgi:quaternary ammonium compound-resistance protein SugE